MDTSRWTKAVLDEASEQGDNPTVHPNADELAAQVMGKQGGIARYNRFLEAASKRSTKHPTLPQHKTCLHLYAPSEAKSIGETRRTQADQ